MIPSPKSIGLYVHLPWCIHKCPYCDFNSHEASFDKVKVLERDYFKNLIKEFSFYKELISDRQISSIFFGGGTPSLISPQLYEELISEIHTHFNLSNSEITMEANPGTIDINNFKDYAKVGINRISLGIQSFNDKHLKKLERIHSSDEAKHAIDCVQKYFSNLNLDLMFGLPQQDLEELQCDLQTACDFEPNHLSFYHLTIEPQTAFYKTPPEIPSDDDAFEMYQEINQQLQRYNYVHYETSAFAKQGYQSQHNLNYWLFGDYLGLGAGAHSKITHYGEIFRMNNTKNPKTYIDSVHQNKFFSNKTNILKNDLPFEFMMNTLRLTNGFQKNLFEERTGIELNNIRNQINDSISKELLHEDESIIKPTKKGVFFLNEILHNFL